VLLFRHGLDVDLASDAQRADLQIAVTTGRDFTAGARAIEEALAAATSSGPSVAPARRKLIEQKLASLDPLAIAWATEEQRSALDQALTRLAEARGEAFARRLAWLPKTADGDGFRSLVGL